MEYLLDTNLFIAHDSYYNTFVYEVNTGNIKQSFSLLNGPGLLINGTVSLNKGLVALMSTTRLNIIDIRTGTLIY